MNRGEGQRGRAGQGHVAAASQGMAGLQAQASRTEAAAHEEAWITPNVPARSEGDAATQIDLGELVLVGGLLLLIVGVALALRFVFLYYISDPNVLTPSWSNDTWHRWQIAYLSNEIGFTRGFLRLWDLKGLEYYWGVLHPILSAGLFRLTGSVDVMLLRWLTLLFGIVNIIFIYLLGRRFWGLKVAVAAAAFTALNPIVIFNDPSGMVEPLSFAFLLAGIYFFPGRPVLAGVLLALGATARAEAWLMSAGLVGAALLGRQSGQKKFALGLAWGLPILAYMKYLLDRTGNAIYPIYWNFLANAAGRWEFREGFTDYQLAVRPVLAAVFIAAGVAALWTLWKRPRGYLVYLLGFGTTAFISGFIGLTAYLKSYEPWFWLTRFFVFPYMFAGLLAAILLFYWLPRKLPSWRKLHLGWAISAVLLLGMQFSWPSVLHDIEQGYTSQTASSALSQQGQWIGAAYEGGTVLIPEGTPQLTYAIGRYSGIPGERLLGQMYGPTYYYEGGDPLENWESVGPQMWQWFEDENIRLLIMSAGDERFLKMIDERPQRFTHVGAVPRSSFQLYKVR